MEPDLSLIEISGEEDSLVLQQSPLHFGCSPLSSNLISVTKGNADGVVLGSSSSYSNKENLKACDNKSGMPNLSIEPQKMKRSKKGGGYNLRKSLAWDRAFLTEEGVLNSLELSMITGALDGDGLSVIDEHRKDLNSNTVGGSSFLKTLEEDLFKELPSGKPNERNAACSLSLKRDSSIRGSIASVSKNNPPRSGVNRTVLNGRVTPAPAAPVSQKRLLNTTTTKVVTRNSKIPKFPVPKQGTSLPPAIASKLPKFPVSKQDSCLPSMTRAQSEAGGSCIKSSGITQPAHKSVSSKVKSNIKTASYAMKATSQCMSKSSKPSTENARKDVTKSSLEMDSLTNRQARDTTKMSKLVKMTSNRGVPTGAADMSKSIDEISNTTVSSRRNSDSVVANKKNMEGQAVKPSGLRMPSPSLKFFSELKVPVPSASSKDNIVASIAVMSKTSTSSNQGAANHIHESKSKLQLDSMRKVDPSSQPVNEHSISSIVDQTDYKGIPDASRHELKVQVPLGVKTPDQGKNKGPLSEVLDDFGKQYMGHLPDSVKDEERDRKDDKLVLSRLEFVRVDNRTSSFSQDHRTGDENMLKCSSESCREERVGGTSETITVAPQEGVNTECTLPVMNDEVMVSQIDSIGHYPNLTLTADSGLAGSIIDNKKSPEERNICDSSHIVCEGTLKLQIGGGNSLQNALELQLSGPPETSSVVPEGVEDMGSFSSVMHDEVIGSQTDSISDYNNFILDSNSRPLSSLADKKLPEENNTCHFSPISSESVSVLLGGGNSLPKATYSLNLDEGGFPVIVCEDGLLANDKTDNEMPSRYLDSSGQKSCSADCDMEEECNQPVEMKYQQQRVDEKKGHATFDSELSSVNASDCSEGQHDVRGDSDLPLTKCEREFSSKLPTYESLDISNVSPVVQAQNPELKGKASLSKVSVVDISEAAQVYHSSIISQDRGPQSPYGQGMVNGNALEDCTVVADNQFTEVTTEVNNQEEKQVFRHEMFETEQLAQSNEIDLNGGMPLEHSSPKRDEEDMHAGITSTIDKVCYNSEKVADQTDSLLLLANNYVNPSDNATDLGLHPSGMKCEDQVIYAVANPSSEGSCSPDKRSKFHQLVNGLMNETVEEYTEHDKPVSSISPRDHETRFSQHDYLPGENKSNKQDPSCRNVEDANTELRTSQDDKSADAKLSGFLVYLGKESRSTDCYMAGECSPKTIKQQYVDDKQGYAIVDGELSTVDVSHHSEGRHDMIENGDLSLTNCQFFNGKEFMKSMNYDSQDISVFSPELKAKSSQPQVSMVEISNDGAVEGYHSSTTSEDGEPQLSYVPGAGNSYTSEDCTSVAYSLFTKVTSEVNNQENVKQPLKTESFENEALAKSNELNLNAHILLECGAGKRNEEDIHVRMTSNTDEVFSNSEEVEDQTVSLTHLSKGNKDSTDQTTDLDLHSSVMKCEDQVRAVLNPNSEESCTPDNRQQDGHAFINVTIQEGIRYDKPVSQVPPREPETGISQHDTVHAENITDIKGTDCMEEEDANCKLRVFQDDQRKLTRPAPNAVPFSDEWLAAIESAGEEILTLKTGAVQHSPPDKSIPEPSPWSPVKKKNNQAIGPFDCTKYTNNQI